MKVDVSSASQAVIRDISFATLIACKDLRHGRHRKPQITGTGVSELQCEEVECQVEKDPGTAWQPNKSTVHVQTQAQAPNPSRSKAARDAA